jgi:hypothetical protein
MHFSRIDLATVSLSTLVCVVLLCSFSQSADAETLSHHDSHAIEVKERILRFEDGLLLGNGDLSVSVYQSADRIIWRFGKSDVWDRRLDLSEDPRPVHIDELAHGIKEEGWKCLPYGGPVDALRGTKDSKRMFEVCQGSPPSYRRFPYPCPKPVGELSMQLPPDLQNMKIHQRLDIEKAKLTITCSWSSGVKIHVECFVPPKPNVLVVQWWVENWDAQTRLGNKPPVWFSLYRWADPTVREFAAQIVAKCQHPAFQVYSSPKATPLDPPTTKSDGETYYIEQAFAPEPTFKEGFRYAMAPLGAGLRVKPVEMSAAGEARLHLLPESKSLQGSLAVAVGTSSDDGGPLEEVRRVRAVLDKRPTATWQNWADENHNAATAFWSKSRLQVDEPLLENLWYETLHARRCTFRRGVTPPGLFLPSTVQDYSHWHGDYHTNYNYQSPFWGDYTANHLEIGDSYFDGVEFMLPMGRKIARDYYNCRGVFIQLTVYPIRTEEDCLGIAPMGRMAYMTGWIINQYWWRYLYTMDREWLRTTGYPVIRDCALFYTDFMQKGDDGRYHIFPSNQGEDGFSGDPKDYTDRPQVMQHLRYCLRAAIMSSEILEVDESLRAQWRERLQNCAGDDGKSPPKLEGLAKHCYEANPPEFGIGRPYLPQSKEMDGEPWPSPESNLRRWYFGHYPWATMKKLRGGEFHAVRDLPVFCDQIRRWRRPNGLICAMAAANYGPAGAWSESLGVIAPLQEMMLQSWDGALRIFPSWPPKLAARFDNFRAEGAFLVSAAWSEENVTRLTVYSEQGSPCRLYSPWPEGVSIRDSAGEPIETTVDNDGRIGFVTRAGFTYELQPAKRRG